MTNAFNPVQSNNLPFFISPELQEEYAHQLDLAEYQKMDGKCKTDSLREQYKNQVKDLKKDVRQYKPGGWGGGGTSLY